MTQHKKVTKHKKSVAWRQDTQLVRGGLTRSGFEETSEALYLTSGFVYGQAAEAEAAFKGDIERYMYGRFGNPTVGMFQERMALIEGAQACWGTATGMAAVFASLMCQLRAGDHVVSARALFGSCQYIMTEILPRFGVSVTTVDGADLDQWEKALKRKTQAVFFETPSNPALEIIDVAAVSKLAHAAGANVIIDNVFATPILQSPLALGADIVVYSATKHIDGQGRCLGGAVLGSTPYCQDVLKPFIRNTGPSISPFNAWVLLKGLETLKLRVEKQSALALDLALFLENHPKVMRVLYPGMESHPQHHLAMTQMRLGGTLLSFELAETGSGKAKDMVFRLLDGLRLIDISNNLGDMKSLITHPATTTHQRIPADERVRMGITDSMIRISTGAEDINDLKEDLSQALAQL